MTTIRNLMASLEIPGLRPTERDVLHVLCTRADQYKCKCKVGLARLAKDTGRSPGGVRDALAWLEELGHITVERRPGKRSVYTVHVLRDPAPEARTTPRLRRPHPAPEARTPRASGAHMKESLDFSGRDGAAAIARCPLCEESPPTHRPTGCPLFGQIQVRGGPTALVEQNGQSVLP